MKHKTLHVVNFGPISDAKVELRAFNMFIGEQAIGKSTLAKLITIFTDYVSLVKLINNGVDFWIQILKEYGLDVYKDDAYTISYDMSQEDQQFHLEINSGKISCHIIEDGKKNTNRKSIISKLIDLSIRIIHHKNELKKNIDALSKSEKRNEEILALFTNSLYVPAERIIYSVMTNLLPALALANSTIPKILLRFMVDLNNAKAEYPKFHIGMLNIDFQHETSEDLIVVEGNRKSIPLTVASSGIQSLVPLLLVLHYAINKREYSSFVIEEPECNLFPTKQVALLKEIIKVIKYSSRTLTITTHSPYLLSAMNNILYAGNIVEKYGEGIRKFVDEIIPADCRLNSTDCSVYSLGADINGGVYCRSLMDEETGMIDFNSLDSVSEELGVEFDALQDIIINFDSEN